MNPPGSRLSPPLPPFGQCPKGCRFLDGFPNSPPFYIPLQYLKDDIYPEAILSRNCAIVAFWTFWLGKEPRLEHLIGQIAKLSCTTTWLWRDTWGHHWAWSRGRRRCLRRCRTGEGGIQLPYNCLKCPYRPQYLFALVSVFSLQYSYTHAALSDLTTVQLVSHYCPNTSLHRGRVNIIYLVY